jgi:hypothetical protein
MKWIKDHVGLLLVLPLGVLLYIFPLRSEAMLPDPLETLFDWAGEVVAYTWIAIAGGFLALWPVPIIAGLVDRCRPVHTMAFIALVATLAICVLPSSFPLLLCLIVGLLLGTLLASLYLLTRYIRALVMQPRTT